MLRLPDGPEKIWVAHNLCRGTRGVERDHALAEAKRLLAEGLYCLVSEREELPPPKMGDPCKPALAVRIRAKTTEPNA